MRISALTALEPFARDGVASCAGCPRLGTLAPQAISVSLPPSSLVVACPEFASNALAVPCPTRQDKNTADTRDASYIGWHSCMVCGATHCGLCASTDPRWLEPQILLARGTGVSWSERRISRPRIPGGEGLAMGMVTFVGRRKMDGERNAQAAKRLKVSTEI